MPEPQSEHKWLEQLVGEWTYEMEACMDASAGPDHAPTKHTGTDSVRSLNLWVVCEGTMPGPDGSAHRSVMTLGYDPAKKRFVGTFIASMMTHLWLYDGELDAAGKVLTLNADGPSFTDPTKMAKYQDVIEMVSPDHRTLTSRFQGDDGQWHQFMVAHYRRKP